MVVVAVGVELAHQRLAQFPADAPGGRTGHAIEQQFRFQALQGLDEQARGDLVPRQVHVERAVGLDVLQRQALQPGEFAQCAKLVEHVVDQLDGRRGDVPTPEADQVAEARMGADGHAMLGGHLHGAAHAARVAGMETGGDVGAADQRHDRRVHAIADGPWAEAFAHVGIEVDFSHCPQASSVLLLDGATVKAGKGIG